MVKIEIYLLIPSKTLNLPYHTRTQILRERKKQQYQLVSLVRGGGRSGHESERDREIFWVWKLGIFIYLFRRKGFLF